MLECMAGFCSYFPNVEIKGRFLKNLERLGSGIEPGRYAGMALFVSFAVALIAGLVGFVFLKLIALPVAILCFAIVFAFFAMLPGMEVKKRTVEVESELPFFLRTVGMLLDMGLPFQRALEVAAEDEGALQEEMARALDDARSGMSLQKALARLAASFDSLAMKRAMSQVLSAYEVGSSGNEMKRIADELLSLQRHSLKEYSAKSAMFGLMFIMSSAILPTFFLIYAILGRLAFGTDVDDLQVAIALLVFFPLISILIAALSKATMPRYALAERGGFDAWLLLPGFIFIGGFVLLPGFQPFVLGAGVAVCAVFFYGNYREERRLEDMEAQLPDALFAVSGLPKATRAERIFEILERGGHGALSAEAAKSRSQLGMNLRTDAVLDDLWKRNPSRMIRRVCLMMRQMMRTNSLDRLGTLGEDIITTFQIKRERSQVMAMQKYTLAFGALLIPLILKMALHILQGMSGLFQDASVADSLAFATAIVPPYLVIYSLICAEVMADAEGRKSAAALYFLCLAAASLAAFQFINF